MKFTYAEVFNIIVFVLLLILCAYGSYQGVKEVNAKDEVRRLKMADYEKRKAVCEAAQFLWVESKDWGKCYPIKEVKL